MKWHSRILSVLTASAALFFALTARGMLRHAGIEQILCCDYFLAFSDFKSGESGVYGFSLEDVALFEDLRELNGSFTRK